jgi:hypothetical protein
VEARVSSELLERYKVLTAELTQLDRESERVKGERELVCGQLLAKDGKGFAYDLGDGMPMVIATTKIGSHYMAPKNKWQKSGRPPKPPKVPRAKKEKPVKEVKPAVKRAIVGGKIVEIPIERKSSSPPVATVVPQPVIPKPAPVPTVEVKRTPVAKPERVQPAEPPDDVLEALSEATAEAVPDKKPEPQKKELDPLEAALAELEID